VSLRFPNLSLTLVSHPVGTMPNEEEFTDGNCFWAVELSLITDDLHLKGSETSHWSGQSNQRCNKHSGSISLNMYTRVSVFMLI